MKHFITKTFMFEEREGFFSDLDKGDFFLYENEIYMKLAENTAIKFSENFYRIIPLFSKVFKGVIHSA